MLRFRSEEFKELEIVLLRHELPMLRRVGCPYSIFLRIEQICTRLSLCTPRARGRRKAAEQRPNPTARSTSRRQIRSSHRSDLSRRRDQAIVERPDQLGGLIHEYSLAA
jgi:hypothetical protein